MALASEFMTMDILFNLLFLINCIEEGFWKDSKMEGPGRVTVVLYIYWYLYYIESNTFQDIQYCVYISILKYIRASTINYNGTQTFLYLR